MDSNPACGRTFEAPERPPNTMGCGGSDPLVPVGMQHSDALAEGLRWVLSIEEEIYLDDRFLSSVLEKGPFCSR